MPVQEKRILIAIARVGPGAGKDLGSLLSAGGVLCQVRAPCQADLPCSECKENPGARILQTPSGASLEGVLCADEQTLGGTERHKTNELISAQLCPLPGLTVGPAAVRRGLCPWVTILHVAAVLLPQVTGV